MVLLNYKIDVSAIAVLRADDETLIIHFAIQPECTNFRAEKANSIELCGRITHVPLCGKC